MKELNSGELTPPQPIPYPKNPLIKNLYRLPILLYRLRLGPLIGKYILILSTFGRKTGKIRRTPVEYFSHQGRIFVMSGFGKTTDWYQNLQVNPQAGLNIKGRSLCAIARKPQTEAEWNGVIAFLKASPVSYLSEPNMVNQLDDPEVREAIKEWPVLTFDLTENPCPSPVKPDLVWIWPAVLLTTMLYVIVKWLHKRKP